MRRKSNDLREEGNQEKGCMVYARKLQQQFRTELRAEKNVISCAVSAFADRRVVVK